MLAMPLSAKNTLRNTSTSVGRQELVLVCKELSAMQQLIRECNKSVQSVAAIKVTQTQSTGSGGYLNVIWTEQTTPKSKSFTRL